MTAKKLSRPQLRRLLRKQLRRAIARLESSDREGVHEARKHIKRVRAAFRLLRALGMRGLRKDARRLRKAARRLSTLRDAQVLRITHDEVRAGAAALSKESLAIAERVIANRARRIVRHARDDGSVAAAVRTLRHVHRSAKRWHLPSLAPDAIDEAISVSVRDARAARRAAKRTASGVNIHRWRRRVKTLYLQLRLLEREAATPLEQLEETLGLHQNLVVFRAAIADELSHGSLSRGTYRLLDSSARRRQRALQRQAFRSATEALV